MRILLFLSDLMIPLLFFYIIGFGLLMKKDIYNDFVTGAFDGLKTVVKIMPTLIGLMTGVKHIAEMQERKKIYQRIQEIVIEEQPIVPLFNDFNIVAYSSKIGDFNPKNNGLQLEEVHLFNE